MDNLYQIEEKLYQSCKKIIDDALDNNNNDANIPVFSLINILMYNECKKIFEDGISKNESIHMPVEFIISFYYGKVMGTLDQIFLKLQKQYLEQKIELRFRSGGETSVIIRKNMTSKL